MQPAGEVLQVHTAAEDQGIRRGVPEESGCPGQRVLPRDLEVANRGRVDRRVERCAGPRQITARAGPVVGRARQLGCRPSHVGRRRAFLAARRTFFVGWRIRGLLRNVSRLIRRDDLLLGLGIPTPGTRGRDQAESAQQYCERHTTPDASHEDSSRSATARTIRGQSLDEQGSQSPILRRTDLFGTESDIALKPPDDRPRDR